MSWTAQPRWIRAVLDGGRLLALKRGRHLALAGLAAGLGLAPLPVAVITLAAAGFATVLAALGSPRTALLIAAMVVTGASFGGLRLAVIDGPGRGLAADDRVAGRAYLLGPPRVGQFGASVEVELVDGAHSGARLLARLPRDERLGAAAGAGTEVELRGRVRRPPAVADGGFDLGAFLRRRGLAAEVSVEEVRGTGGRRDGIVGWLDRVRERAEHGIAGGLTPPAAALVRGMVLGQDEAIEPVVRDDFRISGLAHVLAVSGQNVMLLAALALPLLSALGLGRSARLGATVGLIALYVPLAGAGPSLQRAGVTGVAGLLALGASRPASRWYALLLAACVTLALNPRACGDPGWQLSFVAVVGILLLADPLRQALSGLPRPLAEGISLTLAATVTTGPLLAHHFGAVSLVSLPANVAALPLVAPIMWLGMLRGALAQAAGAAWPVPQIAATISALLSALLAPLADWLARLAAFCAALPWAQIAVQPRSSWWIALSYLVLAGVACTALHAARRTDTLREIAAGAWRRLSRGRRLVLVAVPAALVAALATFALSPPPAPDRLTVTYLDVGQGDATLIQHPDGTAILFDGGPPEARVANLLRAAGVRRLAMVVMTHASRDHHGGLHQVVERYPVDLLLDGGDGTADPTFRAVLKVARRRGVRRARALAPLSLRAGGLRVRILSPPARPPGPAPEDPNPRAVVAIVSADGFDLMLSGDAESETLAKLTLPDVDALKVPHHGSADPGLPGVLERLRPEIAGIEVGEGNSYGHPTPETLSALSAAGVATYRTDRDGSIRLTVDAGEMSVATER